MASEALSRAEGKPSFSCRCIKVCERYDGCVHTETTIVTSKDCPPDCQDRGGSTARYNWSCSQCTADNVEGGLEASSHYPKSLDDLPQDSLTARFRTAEEVYQSQLNKMADRPKNPDCENHSAGNDGVKKAEEANKQLKKLITTLTFTSEMDKIFDNAEKALEHAHESWETSTSKELLKIVAAAQRGDKDEIKRIMDLFGFYRIDLGVNVKNSLRNAKRDVIKQCEDGVERMLEALEETNL